MTLSVSLLGSYTNLEIRIGEKMLEWTDEDPLLEKILEGVTLYWMTDTIPRCLYHSRGVSLKIPSLSPLD